MALPLLLTRAQFLAATGLRSPDLSAMVRMGTIVPQCMPKSSYRPGAKQKCRYRKQDVALLTGLDM